MSNSVLRSSVRDLALDDTQWREIEHLLSYGDGRWEQEINVYGLYAAVRGMLQFAHALVTEALPRMKTEIARPRAHISQENRVVLRMTVTNLQDNVKTFVERIGDLYRLLVPYDEKRNGEARAFHKQFPELKEEDIWDVERRVEALEESDRRDSY
ncbi:MAG: hypothetical protein ACOCYG_04535 [Spirochaetota bacterium]